MCASDLWLMYAEPLRTVPCWLQDLHLRHPHHHPHYDHHHKQHHHHLKHFFNFVPPPICVGPHRHLYPYHHYHQHPIPSIFSSLTSVPSLISVHCSSSSSSFSLPPSSSTSSKAFFLSFSLLFLCPLVSAATLL